MSIVYDAGVLIAAERGEREIWADHRVRLELGMVPSTTAPVVAQVSRSPRQAQLRRLLRGCDVEAFDSDHAHQVGALLEQAAAATDVVDAHVIVVAAARSATVLTSDPDDLRHLSGKLSRPVAVRRI